MRNPIAVYSLTLAAVVAAVMLRWLLDPVLGPDLAFVTLFGYVAGAVWLGGYRPGIIVVLLGYLGCAYFFIEPRNSFDKGELRHIVGLIAYLCTCTIIIAFGEAMRKAQQKAEVGRETLRVMLGSIGDAIIAVDKENRITLMNSVAESLTGWTQSEAALQKLDKVFRTVNEETRQPVESPALRALREGIVVGLANHTILIAKDGREIAIDDSAAPIRNHAGDVVGCVLIFRDFSARRQAERRLAKELTASRFLAAIVESSEDAIVTKSLDGIIQTWNEAAQRLFGYSEHEAIGKHVSIIIPPDRIEEEQHIIAQLRQGKRVEHFETVRRKQSGEPIHISLTVSPIMDDDGNIVGASKIARDISDRKHTEERIYELMTSLKERDRLKDEFLAMLAHELRGPLAPLRNMLELMKHSEGNEELIKDARTTMERQLNQLIHLVDDLIDVNRISRNKIELRKDRVELASILHQALEASRSLANEAQHQLRSYFPAEPVYLQADPVRLVQVFGNLLNNACKYTPPGGEISISAERHGTEVVVVVKDNGLGIPAERLTSVFEMFIQVDRTLEWSQGGMGIGLTLVKRLVELHAGTVTARSEGPGLGSEFEVRLPILDNLPESPPAAMPKLEQLRSETRSAKILVVDDNVDAAKSLAMLLKMLGHEIVMAHNGLEAVAAVEEHRPEIILMDIGLPEMNGYDACRRIRQSPQNTMLMIALTGWGQEEDRRKSKEAGFDGHLVKPVDFNSLMNLINQSDSAKE